RGSRDVAAGRMARSFARRPGMLPHCFLSGHDDRSRGPHSDIALEDIQLCRDQAVDELANVFISKQRLMVTVITRVVSITESPSRKG
ncbi:hypothetical protein, partial [Methylobacterium sp. CCH7-A2]|uniref:hypothetical protein n=1 Tax=Methylobacterium sp. CCH7-A2 TaxID=1768789 RepID=UPI0018D1F925